MGIGAGVDLMAVIPVADDERRESIELNLDRVATEPEYTTGADETTLTLFQQRRADVIAAVERVYVENRTGDFEIGCRYQSESSGIWNGALESEVLKVRITDEGDSLTDLVSTLAR